MAFSPSRAQIDHMAGHIRGRAYLCGTGDANHPIHPFEGPPQCLPVRHSVRALEEAKEGGSLIVREVPRERYKVPKAESRNGVSLRRVNVFCPTSPPKCLDERTSGKGRHGLYNLVGALSTPASLLSLGILTP